MGGDPVRISEGRITDHRDRVEVSWGVSSLAVSRLWFAGRCFPTCAAERFGASVVSTLTDCQKRCDNDS